METRKANRLVLSVAMFTAMLIAFPIVTHSRTCADLFGPKPEIEFFERDGIRVVALNTLSINEATTLAGRYALDIRLKGENFVGILLESPQGARWTSKGALSEANLRQFDAMNAVEAKIIVQNLSARETQKLSLAEEAALGVARGILTYDQAQRAKSLHYRGVAIVPEVMAVVRGDQALPVGLLYKPTNGEPILNAVARGILSREQIFEAIKQIEEQIQILADNGFVHGALTQASIEVSFAPTLRARLVGFEPANTDARAHEKDVAHTMRQLLAIQTDLLKTQSE